jgi:Mn2+/Fe2+ NRAMP family transporter
MPDATEGGAAGMPDANTDRDALPVLAARIARRRASRGTAHKGLLGQLGPGLITGASDDDPSGIATYSQAGAQFGYAMCWVMLFCFPLMVAIQEISARMGRVTGQGIAGNIRAHYSHWVLYVLVGLLLLANTINLGADLGAMAAALNLLIGGPTGLYVAGFAIGCTYLEVFSSRSRDCKRSARRGEERDAEEDAAIKAHGPIPALSWLR